MIEADIAIIGAGMAGASMAAAIGNSARVVLIEGESQPGYHATGRSAAFWTETYGGPAIQPLTSASRQTLEDGGFLGNRGALTIAARGRESLLDAMIDSFAGSGVTLQRCNREALESVLPGIRSEWIGGVAEPSTCDIDVAALHAFCLKEARTAGVVQINDTPAQAIERHGGRWHISGAAEVIAADIVVNAAGAWAGEVAAMAGAMPIAITPYRRTIVQLAIDPPVPADLPLVLDAAGQFYFKPEAGGRLWLSPHDETPLPPGDVAPDELDIALAISRLEAVMDWRVMRKERAWAGLRSFAPDRLPIYGFDQRQPGFFWFAGQGGFGIQTAPAAAMIGAALLLNRSLPDAVSAIDASRYSPTRF